MIPLLMDPATPKIRKEHLQRGRKILHSKLHPPRLPGTIKRERLRPLLIQIGNRRVTTVTAGAGYGKTTLVAQTAKCLGVNSVWYGLDPSDRDLIIFLSYMIAGLRKFFPEFGSETGEMLKEGWNLPLESQILLSTFLSELEHGVKDELLFILDDFHHIQDSPEIHKALTFLLNHLPFNLHIVFISRTNITLPLSRLRAMRQVLDILEEDLIFTPDEIQRLFFELFDTPLEPKVYEALYRKTGGWISGLILFYHYLRGRPSLTADDLLSKLQGSHKMIFGYLEENVYETLPRETKDFLIRTSVLSLLNTGFCDRFLGVDHSEDILRELEGRHLFTYSTDDKRETFSYHTLFRDFLKNKLTLELDRESIRELHSRAAALLEAVGEDEEALDHYLEASRIKEACAILSRIGRQLVMEGRLQKIHAHLEELSDRYLKSEPWIQYIKAQSLQVSGRSQEAVSIYQKALAAFRKKEIPEGEVICLTDLGRNAFMMGDFKAAEYDLRKLLKHTPLSPDLSIEILGYLIIMSSYKGKTDEADRYFVKAIDLLPHNQRSRQGSEGWLWLARGFRHLFSGDFQRALELGEEARAAIQPLALYRLLTMCHQLISTAYFFLGFYKEGIQHAEKGLETVHSRGLLDSNWAWLLFCASLNSTGLGDMDRAISYGQKALQCFRDQSSQWGQAHAYMALSTAHWKSGKVEQAEESARLGLKTIDGLALPLISGQLMGYVAICLMEKGGFEEALPFLEGSQKIMPAYIWLQNWLDRQFARYYWGIGQKKKALNHLLSSFKTCEGDRDEIWVMSEKHWIQPLLIAAFLQGVMQDHIRRLFRKIGPTAAFELGRLRKSNDSFITRAASTLLKEIPRVPPPGLNVRLLGKFQLMIGDTLLPEKHWRSQKAKMLFKYLAYYHYRGYIGKEILMELLWPEEEPKKSAKRFHVTLASLRKTLEPDIPRGTPSSYIKSIGDAYELDLGEHGWIDTEQFLVELQSVDRGEASDTTINHYLNAVSLYRGDLLEEDPYVDWCAEEREKLRERYLYCLSKIIAYYEHAGDFQKCIEYAGQYLNVDPYGEDVYQQLMRYYARSGNRAGVVKTFKKCKQNLVIKLNCPLSPETEALYSALMSG